MIRVCTVAIDGYEQPFKIKSLTCAEADEFVKESKDMIARQSEIEPGEWLARTQRIVSANTMCDDVWGWKLEALRAELDLSTVNALYLKILEFSGLRTGEVEAVSASPKSVAA